MKPDAVSPNPTLLVLAALAVLAWAIIGIAFAMLAPPHLVPRLFFSLHVEHFVAFYALALISAAALPGLRLRNLGALLAALSMILEAIRLIAPTHRQTTLEDALCDLAGIVAALAPILVGRLREAYLRRALAA